MTEATNKSSCEECGSMYSKEETECEYCSECMSKKSESFNEKDDVDTASIINRLEELIRKGKKENEAIKIVSKEFGIPPKEIEDIFMTTEKYQEAIKVNGKNQDTLNKWFTSLGTRMNTSLDGIQFISDIKKFEYPNINLSDPSKAYLVRYSNGFQFIVDQTLGPKPETSGLVTFYRWSDDEMFKKVTSTFRTLQDIIVMKARGNYKPNMLPENPSKVAEVPGEDPKIEDPSLSDPNNSIPSTEFSRGELPSVEPVAQIDKLLALISRIG
jgi:hypothetical protein